jgi:plastocyanin
MRQAAPIAAFGAARPLGIRRAPIVPEFGISRNAAGSPAARRSPAALALLACGTALATAALLAAAPAAQADERIVAGANNQYLNSNVTIDQGEALYFRNVDVQSHDVTARDKGANGKPLFSTPLIGAGEEALVVGAQALKTGSYQFFCSAHSFMVGTVNVSSAGTPQGDGAGGGSDTTAPKARLKILDKSVSKVRKAGKLRVRVTTDEAGNVHLEGRVGSKLIGTGTGAFPSAGTKTVTVALTKSGKKVLKGKRSVTVKVKGHATDNSGNGSNKSTKRKLKG